MMFLFAVNLKSQSKVDVEFNPNIATYSIAEYLVTVPENSGDVYITGNQTSIGSWNPPKNQTR